jgi:hypothetical protein
MKGSYHSKETDMNKPTATFSAALAGLFLTAGIASAQVASPVPIKAGEASTVGTSSQPNPAEKTDQTTTSRAEVKAQARAQIRTDENSNLPKGEASTTGPNGQPNMLPAGSSADTRVSTRAERRAERDMHKAVKNANKQDFEQLAKRPDPMSQGSQGTPK